MAHYSFFFFSYFIFQSASEGGGDDENEMKRGDTCQPLWTCVIDGVDSIICITTLLFMSSFPTCESWHGMMSCSYMDKVKKLGSHELNLHRVVGCQFESLRGPFYGKSTWSHCVCVSSILVLWLPFHHPKTCILGWLVTKGVTVHCCLSGLSLWLTANLSKVYPASLLMPDDGIDSSSYLTLTWIKQV